MYEFCKFVLTVSATAGLVMLIGCSGADDQALPGDGATAEDVQREAAETADAAGSFARSTVEQYKHDMREAVRNIDRDIEKLETRAESLSGDARAQVEDTIEQLRNQRDAFVDRLEQARADTADAWQDIRSGLDRAWNDLEQAGRNALDRFGD